jgi:sodium-dependent dicarboxylate transporter 2/3/5
VTQAENPFRQKKKPPRSAISIAVSAALALGVYFLLPAQIGELQRRTVALFVVAAVLWATEALPLFATSFCVIGLEILILANDGGLAGVGNLNYKQFFLPFSSSIIILFMGGFILSRAVTKHRIDRAIAARLLRPFARSPLLMIYGVLGISGFFPMWMSNTATAAMMVAIIAPVIDNLKDSSRFSIGLILAVPFGASVGGIGTPIGTPPNAVALAALRQAGYGIGFLEWMMVAVPLAVLLLALIGLLLYFFFPPDADLAFGEIEEPGDITAQGVLTLLILGASVLLWLTGGWHGISVAGVAMLAAAAEGQLAILTALACSFALAMPVSTPPNAIAFATGRIPVGDMVRVGGGGDLDSLGGGDAARLPGDPALGARLLDHTRVFSPPARRLDPPVSMR